MDPTETPKQWSKVTTRAFEVIEAIDELGGATVTELSDHLDLAASTVHNHLGALQRQEYVVKDETTYRLGLRFLSLGISVRDNHEMTNVSISVVEDMARETGETTWSVALENDWVVFLYAALGEQGINTYGKVGSRRRPHANASGKAILAHLPEEKVHGLLDRTGLPAYTENTITDREELFEEFETIRERGYAENRGEYLEGGHAIACAVLRNNEPIGALGISGPARRFQTPRLSDELANVLLEGKNIIELELTDLP